MIFRVSQCILGTFGHLWAFWALLATFGHFGAFWALLGILGTLGTLGNSGHFGHFWAFWALLGQTSINFQNLNFFMGHPVFLKDSYIFNKKKSLPISCPVKICIKSSSLLTTIALYLINRPQKFNEEYNAKQCQ